MGDESPLALTSPTSRMSVTFDRGRRDASGTERISNSNLSVLLCVHTIAIECGLSGKPSLGCKASVEDVTRRQRLNCQAVKIPRELGKLFRWNYIYI